MLGYNRKEDYIMKKRVLGMIYELNWLIVSRRVRRRFKKQNKFTKKMVKKNNRDLKKMKQLSDLLDKL